MAIHITDNATVEVRAPLKMPKADIDSFVLPKEKWINEHLSLRQERKKQRAEFALSIGDTVLLQGKEYPIKAVPKNRAGFDGEYLYVPENLGSQEIKHAVIQIYKLLAKNILINKVRTYAKKMNVCPTAVKINSAKTRWGSCSGTGSVNFSWRLILADDAAIDYVVVHELAHIKEHNHSDRFWKVVESAFPDYKTSQKKLKVLQDKLCYEDWD